MEAKELKIGNIVSTPNQPIFRIDLFDYVAKGIGKFGQISDPKLHPLTWYLQDLKPIEITKQWFYQLGFKSDNDESTILIKNGFDIIELNDGSFELFNHDYPIKIKYVHQLQNLYYALLGEELSLSGI